MLSSKENSRKRKNDLDKRGKYQKFGDTCIQMREPVIKSEEERCGNTLGEGSSSGLME
jgi:hypothetical protein